MEGSCETIIKNGEVMVGARDVIAARYGSYGADNGTKWLEEDRAFAALTESF